MDDESLGHQFCEVNMVDSVVEMSSTLDEDLTLAIYSG